MFKEIKQNRMKSINCFNFSLEVKAELEEFFLRSKKENPKLAADHHRKVFIINLINFSFKLWISVKYFLYSFLHQKNQYSLHYFHHCILWFVRFISYLLYFSYYFFYETKNIKCSSMFCLFFFCFKVKPFLFFKNSSNVFLCLNIT